jgi:hypothetical protein
MSCVEQLPGRLFFYQEVIIHLLLRTHLAELREVDVLLHGIEKIDGQWLCHMSLTLKQR